MKTLFLKLSILIIIEIADIKNPLSALEALSG
jgi:hypothetical protein